MKKSYLLPILSGVMIGTSYIPFPPWALFFCLIPLWSQVVKESSYKKVFLMGWLTQFFLAIIGFHWIPHTIVEFGHLPVAVGALGLLAFASLANLHFPLATVFWLYFKKKGWSKTLSQDILILALGTALLEKINPQIFPWHMGYPWFYGNFPAYHMADVFGFSGLSTLTYVLNAWIFIVYKSLPNRALFKKHALSLIGVFFLLNIGGLYKESLWKKTDAELRVLAVQPNIGNQAKQFDIFGPGFKKEILSKHMELTRLGLQKDSADLILWPETSIPEYLNPEFFYQQNVQTLLQFIQENQTPILTGAYARNLKTNQDSNALFLFNKDAEAVSVYKKYQLLAFGEYLPFSQTFPSLLKLLPMIADFERGPGPQVMSLGDVHLGAQICYEGLHPWFSNELSNLGAQILVNVTNDSWFGHTFETSQHLFMTFARSIEVRRPMIRVTNTGITSGVLADGTILQISPQKSEWTHTYSILYQTHPSKTLFSQFPYMDILFCLIFISVIWIRVRYGKS